MGFPFEKLRVWAVALELTLKVQDLIKSFPDSEKFALSSQIKRVADSVALNIAEGSVGQSKPEFRRFLGIALRSCIEVVACLHIGKSRNLIKEADFIMLYSFCEQLIIQLQALRKSIQQNADSLYLHRKKQP